MTGITLVGTVDVTSGLAGCHRSVVTINTGSNDLCMINSTGCDRCPGGRGFFVAGIANVRTIYMNGALATGGNTVMAGNAVVDEVGMVNARRYPGGDAMTVFTRLRSDDMIGGFTRRDNIVMATGTYPDDLGMIDSAGWYRHPWRWAGFMTGITSVGSTNMVG
jgi:hypothetical protein